MTEKMTSFAVGKCSIVSPVAVRIKSMALLPIIALLTACATPKTPYDYTAFKQSRPTSILVLPPINQTPEVNATIGVMASAVRPLAEAGYYVMPVSLVDETFKQNGLTVPEDIHNVATNRLHDIFGADAAVYIKVKSYGTVYFVLGSQTVVTVEGKIVDLRNGRVIWEGVSSASSAESDGGNSGGLTGLLVKAVVSQIINTANDASFTYASVANQRLLGAPSPNGVLYGPRSLSYQKD